MLRRPPRFTRTAPPFPYSPLFRSLQAEQVGGASHVDVEESAAHQEIGRFGRDILGELGQSLRSDDPCKPALAAPAHQVRHRSKRSTARLVRYFARRHGRSDEHTSELQSLMRISYAVFCLKKKNNNENT